MSSEAIGKAKKPKKFYKNTWASGDNWARTNDLMNANHIFFQLNYTPLFLTANIKLN